MSTLDFLVLSSSTFLPVGDPITHYHSLIWTERFAEPGEFQLETYAVRKTLAVLPMETLVSLRQTTEVMMVENIRIETDDAGIEKLIVSGRSITSFLNHRVLGRKRAQRYKAFSHSPLASALRLIYHALHERSTYDYTRQPPVVSAKNSNDGVLNTVVTDSTTDITSGNAGPIKQRFIRPGPALPEVQKFLRYRPYGFRTIRPPSSGRVIDIDSSTGAVTGATNTNITALRWDVYRGFNKSHGQTTYAIVIFDTEIDDLIRPNYTFSMDIYHNEAAILVNNGIVIARRPEGQLTGLSRRVFYIDGGDPEEGYDNTEWNEHNVDEGERILEAHLKLQAVDGEVSTRSQWVYGQDYFLGDIVSVRGRYTPMVRARVTEYIRTDTPEGFEAYPAFTYL
jgi:hypothetical protein